MLYNPKSSDLIESVSRRSFEVQEILDWIFTHFSPPKTCNNNTSMGKKVGKGKKHKK